MLPLYIDGVMGCRVELDDPALRVLIPDKADRLFPLSRISRVICNGKVEWSMSALLACADIGIHLLFLDDKGEVRARWQGSISARQSSLTQRMIDLLAYKDGRESYKNWYMAMEKQAVRSFARRIGLSNWRECSAPEMYQQIEFQLGNEGVYREHLLHSILCGEVKAWLSIYGLDWNNEVLLSEELDLATDIGKLLLWDFYPTLLDMEPETAKTPLNAMAILFQIRNDRCYSLFMDQINKLHHFLLEAR